MKTCLWRPLSSSEPYSPVVNQSSIPRGLAIGNFDSLHLGHQKLLDYMRFCLEELFPKQPTCTSAISFYPHPRFVLAPTLEVKEEYSKLITPLRMRINCFRDFGLDELFAIRFNKRLSMLSPKEFIETVISPIKPNVVVVGTDWRFGKNKEGDIDALRRLGRDFGFETRIVPLLTSRTSHRHKVGSGSLRKLLTRGKIDSVADILGRKFSILGRIVKGDGRGKGIGFPTANVHSQNQFMPKFGVYKTKIKILGVEYHSISNVGIRPTFKNEITKPHLETHIFNFDRDIYGELVEVEFHQWIRGEEKFLTVEDLVMQIKKDIEVAKNG